MGLLWMEGNGKTKDKGLKERDIHVEKRKGETNKSRERKID